MLKQGNHTIRESRLKRLFFSVFFLCLTTITSAAEPSQTVYDSMVLNEDATWSGSVLVRSSVVVAPQATLRIEPGTVVRFGASVVQQLAGLIVQGRLHVAGTAEQPVLFTSERTGAGRGAWRGVVFLATEKRNILEQCRIENADAGIDVRFSHVSLKSVTLVQNMTGLRSRDGVIQMTGSMVTDTGTGIDITNSEFDGREITVEACQRASVCLSSAYAVTSSRMRNNVQAGLEAEECRIRIVDGEFSGNESGALIHGGEGQISMSRFMKNRQSGLRLAASRLKVQRNLFAENQQNGVWVEDDGSLLLNNAFAANGRFNLFNDGHDPVNAMQNWWGSGDADLIRKKVRDAAHDPSVGAVTVFPWLHEKPLLAP